MRISPDPVILPAPFLRWPQAQTGDAQGSAPSCKTLSEADADPILGIRPDEVRLIRTRSLKIPYLSATGAVKHMTKILLLRFDERQPLLCCMQGGVGAQDRLEMVAAGERYCAGSGLIFCAPEKGSPAWVRIRNLQFLWSFHVLNDPNHREHRQHILNYLSTAGPKSLRGVAEVLNHLPGDLEELEPVWWTMVAHGMLRCSLDAYLTSTTVCTLNEAFRSHCVSEHLYCNRLRIAEPHVFRKATELNADRLRTMERHSHWLTLGRLDNPELVDPALRLGMPRSYHEVSVSSLMGASLEPDFDCPLQRDLVSRLMFDYDVTVKRNPQPFPYIGSDGQPKEFTPDLLIQFRDRPALYCIVSNPAFPHSCLDLKQKIKGAKAYVSGSWARFQVFDETTIRTPRLKNIQFLWEHWDIADFDITHLIYARIVEAASSLPSGSRQEILSSHPGLQLDRNDPETYRVAQWVERAWWTLVAFKILRCDLDQPLSNDTVYTLDEWERDRFVNRSAKIPARASLEWYRDLWDKENAVRFRRRLRVAAPVMGRDVPRRIARTKTLPQSSC